MTKQNNFTLIKRAKQLAIEETKAKVLKIHQRLSNKIGSWSRYDKEFKQKVAKIK